MPNITAVKSHLFSYKSTAHNVLHVYDQSYAPQSNKHVYAAITASFSKLSRIWLYIVIYISSFQGQNWADLNS